MYGLCIWLPALYILSNHTHKQLLIFVMTHLHWGKKVRILSQLRESDLPIGDASRTLPSSSVLLEVLPLYRLLVDYIGSKVYSASWGSLTFPLAMQTKRCAQAVAYLSCCPYTNHLLNIWGVKVRNWNSILRLRRYTVNTLLQSVCLTLSIRRKLYGCRFYSDR